MIYSLTKHEYTEKRKHCKGSENHLDAKAKAEKFMQTSEYAKVEYTYESIIKQKINGITITHLLL